MSDPSLPAPVQTLVDAINAGDADAFVAAFTPRGLVSDWGRVFEGGEAIRSWSDTDAIGVGARITVLEAVTDPATGTTTTRFDWRSGKANGESAGIFVTDGDLLASFTIPPRIKAT